ncbi:MAG TPA: hypothetical protein VG816_12940 [Solirubrobacterales bacterium]|nr:hypothetical protein [Solirubrobacterales bacterium]
MVVVTGFALAFAATAVGKRQVVHAGNLFLADDGGISPSALPRHEAAPIVAHLKGEIGTLDGSHPPAVRTVDLDVDKTIAVDAKGLPVCKQSQIEARETAVAKKVCGKALVGSGVGEVEVAFPEQAPFSAQGPVVLFNGGVQGGTTTVLVHAYVAVPAPTAIVTVAKITRIERGPYGMHILARIPRIAGGYGSVTRFELTVGRQFSYKGEKRSFLRASCPTGSFKTKGQVLFSDGTTLGETHAFPCTPKG